MKDMPLVSMISNGARRQPDSADAAALNKLRQGILGDPDELQALEIEDDCGEATSLLNKNQIPLSRASVVKEYRPHD